MKKFLALLLTVAMVLTMVSFASAQSLAGTYDIKVWVANEIVDLTKAQIQRYNETNELGIIFNAEVQPQGEGDAASKMVTDVEAGADLFCFAQDQLSRLITAKALAKLGQGAAQKVAAAYDPDAVQAVTVGDTMYAYPLTADNDYFMYYDKSVIKDEDVGSLEALIAACEAAGKYFTMDLRNAWYAAGFFFGAGCESNWDMDDDGNPLGITDTFNSAEGLLALEGMKKLLDSTAWNNGNSTATFENNSAVVISGIWDAAVAEKILGDNLGVAALPSYTVDGQEYHIGSYFGFKLMGVKPQEDPAKGAALHQLAQYLTGTECALERHAALHWRPAILEAQEDEAVKNDPILVNGVIAQKPYGVVQGAIAGSWWNIAAVIADDVMNATSEEEMMAVLEAYAQKIADVFKLDTSALLFVGAWNGWNNSDENDTYYLKDGKLTLEVPQSDYMGGRIVTPGQWGNDKGYEQVTEGKELIQDLGDNIGDNNIVFLEAGTYTITWDGTAITIAKN